MHKGPFFGRLGAARSILRAHHPAPEIRIRHREIRALPENGCSLAYYDGYRSARVSANLLQAQRDYFGSHTFERTDKPGVFHHDWGGCTDK